MTQFRPLLVTHPRSIYILMFRSVLWPLPCVVVLQWRSRGWNTIWQHTISSCSPFISSLLSISIRKDRRVCWMGYTLILSQEHSHSRITSRYSDWQQHFSSSMSSMDTSVSPKLTIVLDSSKYIVSHPVTFPLSQVFGRLFILYLINANSNLWIKQSTWWLLFVYAVVEIIRYKLRRYLFTPSTSAIHTTECVRSGRNCMQWHGWDTMHGLYSIPLDCCVKVYHSISNLSCIQPSQCTPLCHSSGILTSGRSLSHLLFLITLFRLPSSSRSFSSGYSHLSLTLSSNTWTPNVVPSSVASGSDCPIDLHMLNSQYYTVLTAMTSHNTLPYCK